MDKIQMTEESKKFLVEKWFILKDKVPVKAESWEELSEFLSKPELKRVGLDTFGEIVVSTVFLGFDHSVFGQGAVLFETMIFGGKHDQYQERFSTWEEAEAGHKKAIELVKEEQQKENK